MIINIDILLQRINSKHNPHCVNQVNRFIYIKHAKTQFVFRKINFKTIKVTCLIKYD